MEGISKELCLAHHHLLRIILRALTVTVIDSAVFQSCGALPVPGMKRHHPSPAAVCSD